MGNQNKFTGGSTAVFARRATRQSGQSLVTVLMAAAIGTVVILGVTSMLANMQLSQNSIKYRMDSDTFNEEMRAFLASTDSCKNSFSGVTVDPLSLSLNKDLGANFSLKDADSTIKYSVGGTYDDLKVTAMTLKEYIGGNPSSQVTLVTTINNVKKSNGPQQVPRKINLSVQLDASNKIANCVAMSKMTDGIWQTTTPDHKSIFFVGPPGGGNVGIGTGAPLMPLDVLGAGAFRGWLTPPTSGIGIWNKTLPSQGAYISWNDSNGIGETNISNHMGSGVGGFNFNFFNGTGAYSSTPMAITANGNVGIGTTTPIAKLDVAGAIRAGASTTVTQCGMGAANGEGSQRYNYTLHRYEFCNGTAWGPLGSAATVASARISHGAVIPVPAGFTKAQCQTIVTAEDQHVGTAYTGNNGDPGQWGDDHYGGAQAYYDPTTWQVSCQYFFTNKATTDMWGAMLWADYSEPTWHVGTCRYLTVCTP